MRRCPHHRATTPSMALAVGGCGWCIWRLIFLRLHFFGRLELRYGLARGWLQSLIFDTGMHKKHQNFTKYVHFQMNEKWPKNAVFHYLSSGASIDLALPRSNLEPGSLSVHLLPAWGNKKDQVGLTSTARLSVSLQDADLSPRLCCGPIQLRRHFSAFGFKPCVQVLPQKSQNSAWQALFGATQRRESKANCATAMRGVMGKISKHVKPWLRKGQITTHCAKSTNGYMSLMAFRMRGLARSWSADGQPLACRPCWP